MIIQVTDHKRIVIGHGVRLEGEKWVPDTTKARVSFEKLKGTDWVPAKGLQFDRAHKDGIADALRGL